MSLIITRHAAEQMVRRYLEELDVMRTIAFPDETGEGVGGVTVSKKTLGMKHVTVVWYRDADDNHVVVTVI